MTTFGKISGVLGAAFVIVGLILSWPAYVVIGSAIFALVVLAALYTIKRPNIQIERQIQPPRVPKGLPAIVFLSFSNRGRTSIAKTFAVQPYGSMMVKTPLPRLLGGQSGVRTYKLPTTRRGVFRLGPIEISRSDPFQLASVTQRHGGEDELWVYPHVYPLHPLPSGVTRNLEGPSSDTAPEGNITFHRLREYVVGDDLRMIHWKSTAKTGKLVVRHNVDTSQPYTVVLLNVEPSLYSAETFETAVDIAASAVSSSAAGRSPVQLRTTSNQQVGGPNHGDPSELLDYLTQVAPDLNGSLSEDLTILRRERGGTALVVVTGILQGDDLPQIATMRRKFERVVVVSITPDEDKAPRYPGLIVISATSGQGACDNWNLEVTG